MDVAARDRSFQVDPLRPVPQEPVSREAFLRWAEQQQGSFELVRGRVEMLPGVSRNHATVTLQIGVALTRQLDPAAYRVLVADFGVVTPAGVRYPDVLVEAADQDGAAYTTDAPLFLAEVLSPHSVAIDMVEKAAEYLGLPSLVAYVVFSQDEPRAWVWQRGSDGWRDRPVMIEGADATLPLSGLNANLSLAEIYRNLA